MQDAATTTTTQAGSLNMNRLTSATGMTESGSSVARLGLQRSIVA
jgi:hypothetical protein